MKTATAKNSKKGPIPFLNPISEIHLVPLDLIDTAAQIRTVFTQESIEDLAKDIEARGLLQPILLNPNGDRFQMIAGERRLRAIKHNGAAAIPALLVKASADDALLMQLAENIQREELSLEDECAAIAKLYKRLGSLDKVAEAVKKSKPWCSKRYAMTQKELHYLAKQLLEEGHTEDIELLKALSNLVTLVGWSESSKWAVKVEKGEAGRNEIREALKLAKEKAKQEKEKISAKKPVSHAKPTEPPPPPPWELDDALDQISEALTYLYADKAAIDLYRSWTTEQQAELLRDLQAAHCLGKTDEGFKIILNSTMHGNHDTPFWDVEIAAMIYGHGGNDFNVLTFLAQLQKPRESESEES